MHKLVSLSDPFVNYIIHHEGKHFIDRLTTYIAEKIKRFQDSQWGSNTGVIVENLAGKSTYPNKNNLASRGEVRSTAGSKRSSNFNGVENTHPVTGMEIDPHLDFRALGKNTKCSIDHSKFHCILPYSSVKQPSLKLSYIRYLND